MRSDVAPPIQATEPQAGTVDGVNNGTQIIKIAAAWLMIFMLGIAAAIVTITLVNKEEFGPKSTVSSYLDALKDGNGAKAMGLLHAEKPGANAAALDGKALALSQEKLSDVKIADPTDAPDGQKNVTVSYTLDGTPLSTDFRLTPGSKRWLFFDSWDMVPSKLPTITASVVNANQASINGAAANMPDGKNSFAVFYPGSYELEYRSALFAAPPVTRNVSGPAQPIPAVGLATGPTSDLLAQVDSTIHKYLDECAKQAVLMPTGCPMSAATNNRVTSDVTWSVLEYPAITISPFGGQWILAPLSVKAEVSYEEQDLFTGIVAKAKNAEDFGFTAKLAISGTTVSVTPVVSY
ncbi:hypothetical protein SAMN04489740_3070 [Arthrobacter alpinus]|uniref:DUF4878 domain-containing protein n=1 Tax=Arthrobacter alpinus TaxID=656366 RepID=A0A1H5MQM1_9MICC|nr:hypothetical protein [Arthrobacter alpinus]SEE91440.1 hypothetical protein SAMN04489740_3070 [Arthrobacter alpinus]